MGEREENGRTCFGPHNQLVYEAVIYALAEEPHKRRAKGDMIFADFGATQRCVQYLETAEIPDTLRVSVKVPALKGQGGVEEVLTEKYADIMVPAAEGFDASWSSISTPLQTP